MAGNHGCKKIITSIKTIISGLRKNVSAMKEVAQLIHSTMVTG